MIVSFINNWHDKEKYHHFKQFYVFLFSMVQCPISPSNKYFIFYDKVCVKEKNSLFFKNTF